MVACHREGAFAERLRSVGVRCVVIPELVETPARPRGGHSPPASFVANCADLARAVGTLRRTARTWQADLLYGHTTWSNILTAVAGASLELPVVWHIRNDHSSGIISGSMTAVARATRVRALVAVSQAAAAPYRALRDRTLVVHNGFDRARIEAARARPALRADFPHLGGSETILVGAAGRLVPHKGMSSFAEGAWRVRRQAPHLPVRFVVLGGSPRHDPRNRLRELAAAMPPHSLLTGHVDEPERYLADFDLLVVPSVYADPFPRVVIESLAVGVPVLASRIGGIPEAVRDGREGFLVPPGDVQALADRIVMLAANRALRLRMSERARERADRLFDSTVTARRVEAVLTRYGVERSVDTAGAWNHR
jgi:glycosyltransferase involved in cell wall biosynthesis